MGSDTPRISTSRAFERAFAKLDPAALAPADAKRKPDSINL
jgi:hypothetical protein